MAKRAEKGNMAKLIQEAVTEAGAFRDRLEQGGEEDYVLTSEILSAKYRNLMDAAEEAITSEYRNSGSLAGAKVCEINNGMDDYAMTMEALMNYIEELKDGNE